jgi:DNA-binding response OmpR family regulator
VLYMSGYTPGTIAKHVALEENANFLEKPFSLHSLLARVRQSLDGVKR